ncbi:unnamed protein product [Brachionus calyciflorus]|uniref:Nose resistant-to-fluoxetine protein N-terminal domain-containing protein n=1 Tax=Brachionus calyciflorus TaxID=104777 RepID=A0A814BUT3_9BILA|nr:unnamed protein product [Brachionus calyciflorus]
MKFLVIIFLIGLVDLTICENKISLTPNRKSLNPLNFQQAIQTIYYKIHYLNNLQDFEVDYSNFNEYLNEIKNFQNPSNAPLPLPNVSSDCLTQLSAFALALTSKQQWAIKLIDAFGKPPSGLLQGSLFWAGEYGECVNITEKTFNGKYCTLSKPLSPSMQQVAMVSFKYGICVPNFCNNDDIATLINFGINMLPKNITQILPINLTFIDSSYVTCSESDPLDSSSIMAIAIISVLVFLVLIGTIYDLFNQYSYEYHLKYIYNTTIIQTETGNVINDDEKERIIKTYHEETESSLMKILLGFSIYTNAKKLFSITKSDDQLQCLHAIRFLSIAWVVLGHTYLYQISYSDDILVITDWLKRFSFMVVSNAFFSVDSFFLLSGLLTSYVFLKEVKKRKLSFGLMAKYYFHRIWRLTPPYMLVLMVSALLSKYLGKGPMYPKDGFEINKCQNSWWTNLLYINNLVKTDEPCLGVSWYLANDMQFYFIAPLMLIPFAYGKVILGFSICILLLIGNMISISLITLHYPGTELGILSGNPSYFEKLYIPPWCRIGPYLRFETNILLWLVSLATLGLMLFGIYPNLNGDPLSLTANILYQASSRIIWAVGLSYVIFACVTSHGGFINKILGWSVWVPLSRLSYCLYLFHTVVLLYYNSVQDHPIHMQDSNFIFNYIANMILSLACAFFVSMIFEIPLLGIEKILLKKK